MISPSWRFALAVNALAALLTSCSDRDTAKAAPSAEVPSEPAGGPRRNAPRPFAGPDGGVALQVGSGALVRYSTGRALISQGHIVVQLTRTAVDCAKDLDNSVSLMIPPGPDGKPAVGTFPVEAQILLVGEDLRLASRQFATVTLEPYTLGGNIRGRFAIDDDGRNPYPELPALRAGGTFDVAFCKEQGADVHRAFLGLVAATNAEAPEVHGTIGTEEIAMKTVLVRVNHVQGEPFVSSVEALQGPGVGCDEARQHPRVEIPTVIWRSGKGAFQPGGVSHFAAPEGALGASFGAWVRLDDDAWARGVAEVKGAMHVAMPEGVPGVGRVALGGRFTAKVCPLTTG